MIPFFRSFVFKDPDWDYRTRPLNYDADVALANTPDITVINAMKPDISQFVDRGGRLILANGWSNAIVPPGHTIDYYNSVRATIGARATDARRPPVHGAGHERVQRRRGHRYVRHVRCHAQLGRERTGAAGSARIPRRERAGDPYTAALPLSAGGDLRRSRQHRRRGELHLPGPMRAHTTMTTRLGGVCWTVAVAILIGTTASAALAQPGARTPVDIVGAWTPAGGGPTFFGGRGFQEDGPERQDGPALVDYLGIPLSAAGRMRALSYNSSLLSVPEHQCMPHPGMYSFWGPPDSPAGGPRISSEVDENHAIVAYRVEGMFRRADRTIWMDGRPHPPAHAPHTWAGFTTGRWVGMALETTTTHLKWGWIRRNGVIASDLTTVFTRYVRHGDVLTITVMVNDPLYLTEPYVKTIDFIPIARVSTARFGAEAADARGGVFTQCYPNEEVAPTTRDVPHYLPWANPFLTEDEKRYNLPQGATLGGADSALPEFVKPASRRGAVPAAARTNRQARGAGRHVDCGPSHSRAGQYLDAGHSRREHRRPGRRRGRVTSGHRRVRQRGRDPGRHPDDHRQAHSLHHQHVDRARKHRQQRGAGDSRRRRDDEERAGDRPLP